MRNILLTNQYRGVPLDIIRSVIPSGFELLMLEQLSQENLAELAPRADYLLASGRLNIDENVLSRAENLKMIQRTGVGLDTLDLDSIRRHQIPLYVNQGINRESVAEHALLLMLACLRRLPEIADRTRQGIWKKQEQGTTTHELHGKTVGVIGMGRIAQRLVGLLDGFQVKILYHDLAPMPKEYEEAHHMCYVPLEELFRKSDIITLHCSLTEQTNGLINRNTISLMKDGVVIINTARGAIVDAGDLASSLASGKVGYAGLDAHEEEPFSDAYPLRTVRNAILTPHIGGITCESFYSMMSGAIGNIKSFEEGRYDEIAHCRYL